MSFGPLQTQAKGLKGENIRWSAAAGPTIFAAP
jgi:hypothetical protein